MARRTTRALVAVVLGAAAALAAVRAHGEDAPAGGRTLAAGEVEAFLIEAGHPSTPLGTLRRVEVVKDGGKFYCDVAVGPDGRYVWLTAPLSTLPPSPVPRRGLIDLLAANAGESGLHFLLSGERVVMARALDNRDLTPHGLSQEIRRFVEAVRTGAALWDVSGWASKEGK